MKNNKAILISSAGGHFSELKKLDITSLKAIYVTEKTSTTENSEVDYYLKYGSRRYLIKYFFIFIYNLVQAFRILLKERPQVVISTGAHSAVPFFIFAKLLSIKTIYIESFALVNSKSLTYKLSKKFIDLTIVQHKNMVKSYCDSKYYDGGVY